MKNEKKEQIKKWVTGYAEGQTATACQYVTELLNDIEIYEAALVEICRHRDTYGLGTEPSYIAEKALKDSGVL